MSEFDSKRDKTKAFKASPETIERIDEIIKKSGKGPTEFFEDLVAELAIKSVEHSNDIPIDLRKHYESDVQKLKNATNSIISIFVSQMENISVEKNQWQSLAEKQLKEKDHIIEERNDIIEDQKFFLSQLENQIKEQHSELTELTKVNESINKERDALLKRTEDQEQLIQDRTEKIQELNERINKLNENIVDKDEQLKAIEPIKDAMKALEKEIQSVINEKSQLCQQIDNLKEKHEEELRKKEETLVFACEKEKHKLEFNLTHQFGKEKEDLRNEVRRETEQNIREFYLAEIARKEQEHKRREEQLERQLAELQREIEMLKISKKQ